MARKTKGVRVLTVLFAFIATTGIAAAQQSEINDSLSEIESFVATTLGQIGVIVFSWVPLPGSSPANMPTVPNGAGEVCGRRWDDRPLS